MAKKKRKIPQLIYQYDGVQNSPGYIFIAVNGGDRDTPYHNQSEYMLFIYSEDFECILPIVKAQFPLVDPSTGETHDRFDPCWDNPIEAKIWHIILAELDQLPVQDEEQRQFIFQFTTWIRTKLENADMIIIEGTL